jgi:hypothetical protein
MKKLLVVLLLVLAVSTGYSQTQFKRSYSEAVITQNDNITRKDGQNIVFFNYGNQPVIKIYLADGTVRYYEQISDREENSTDGGMAFGGAMYQEKGKDLKIYVQLFEDRKYGFRVVFNNGDMIQFLE